MVIVAHFLGQERKNVIKPLVSFLSCLAAFFIFNPFAFLDFSFFREQLIEQAQAEGFVGLWHHFRYSLAEGVSWPMLITAITGLVLSFFKHKTRKKSLILCSFPLFFFFTLGFFSQHHERYVLPIVPFVCIYAAYFISQFSFLPKPLMPRAVSLLLIGVVILPNALKAVWLDYIATRKDTRLLAKEWIEKNIETGSKIALDHSFFCPQLVPTKAQLLDKLQEAKTRAQGFKLEMLIGAENYPAKSYYLYFLWDRKKRESDFLSSRPSIEYDFDTVKNNGITYVVVHQDICGKERRDFLERLKREAIAVVQFSPYRSTKSCSEERGVETALPFLTAELFSRKRSGYPIWIYRLK
jgi:hypothetical protein